MADTVAASDRTGGAAARRLAGVLMVGGAVAVALGVYGKAHDPTHEQPSTWFFTSTIRHAHPLKFPSKGRSTWS
jgi:hypothetical protein